MFRGKFMYSGEDISSVIEIRKSVRELRSVGLDENDQMAIYALAFDEDDVPCGCGRLFIGKDSRFHIDTVGVLSSHRHMHIGDLIARMLLYKAESLNAGSVRMFVPIPSIPFFTRYGFRAIGDKINVNGEDGYLLHVDGDKIQLEGTCSCSKGKACSGDCGQCSEKCE
ncbi:MAG: GNAT family N-acetyltransferase [Clostridia bacterium]|nr:GNAT family N-acetyltransferase [Clostridia bacterium]MBQ4156582.1 GNAT family N-acetyltransferase [Clostridia bacterium]